MSAYLAINGYGRYAVLDIEEYRQYVIQPTCQKLLTGLEKGNYFGEYACIYWIL